MSEETSKKQEILKGSISGRQTTSGEIGVIAMTGSFETLPESEEPPNPPDVPLQRRPTPPTQIYEEEDDEIRKAKAMALAIRNNPGLTVEEVRNLVDAEHSQQEQLVAQIRKEHPQKDINSPLANAEAVMQSLMIPGRLASAFAPKDDAQKGATEERKPEAKNPFHNMRESIRAQQEKAKESIQGFLTGKEGQTPRSAPLTKVPPPLDHDATPRIGHKSLATSLPPKLTTTDHVPAPSSASQSAKEQPVTKKAIEEAVMGVQKEADPASPAEASLGSRIREPSNSPTEEMMIPEDSFRSRISIDPAKVRLTAIAWKRRSGFGKMSVSKAWERRRMVLRGAKVEYFKTEKEAAEMGHSDTELVPDLSNSISDVGSRGEASYSSLTATWLERAQHQVDKARANMHNTIAQFGGVDVNSPRGALDLVKESASVGAASGHSGAPTPFAISIKCKGETKWKICFDDHQTQMEWLAALTDVIVGHSVDTYNTLLLQQADPAHADATAGLFPAPQEPTDEQGGVPSDGPHRLWMMQQYYVSSAQLDSAMEGDEDEDDGDEDGYGTDDVPDDVVEAPPAVVARELPVVLAQEAKAEPPRPVGNVWNIREKDLKLAAIMVNVAMMFSRASSTSISHFWYLITALNIALMLMISKETNKEERTTEVVVTTPSRAVPKKVSIKVGETTLKRADSPSKSKKPAGFKPLAGTTTIKIAEPTDVPEKDGRIFGGWREPPGELLMIRSQGYLTNGKLKVPSPGTLYECSRVDIFESPSRYPDMSSRVILPELQFKDPPGLEKTWRAPDVFVVSVSLPTDPPKLTGSADDGGGYTVCMYFTMRKETRDILKRVTATDYDPATEETPDEPQKCKVNAVKLFEEWCRRAPTDPKWFARFKLVPNAQNLKEIGMPSWISKYNGKPVLIKRPGKTGFLYQHPELSCMEFDISLHPFPYLAKQAICYMKENFFKKILVIFGFCIEGRADDELPECVIGLMQLCYPDPKWAIQGGDVFAGTSPRSF